MLKIADIFISEDGCGPYVLQLSGNDSVYFKIIGKELYFNDEIAITPRIYNISIKLNNLSNTITKVIRSINVDRRLCTYTTTTTPPITSTTTTIAPPINPACQFTIMGSPVNNGTTGSWSGCGVYSSPYFTQKLCANIKPVSSISFNISNLIGGLYKNFDIFLQLSRAVAYSDYIINIDIIKNNSQLNLRTINKTESYINIFRENIDGNIFKNPKLKITFTQLGSIIRPVCISDLSIRANLHAEV